MYENLIAISQIQWIALFILVAFLSGLFGKMLNFFISDPEMIFWFWGKFLIKKSKLSSKWAYFSKPLGMCPWCISTWVYLLSAAYLLIKYYEFTVVSTCILALLCLGVTYLTVLILVTWEANQRVKSTLR